MKLADARSAWERFKADRRAGVAVVTSPRLARPVPTGPRRLDLVIERSRKISATGSNANDHVADARNDLARTLKAAGVKRTGEADHERLVKTLGLLGAAHEGKRAAAALQVERLRAKLGKQWNYLLV